MKEQLYPLKFEPILKSVIWGGDKICKFKNIYPVKNKIGECLELSGLEKENSIIKNGFLKGKSLNEITLFYKEKLFGKSIFEYFGNILPFSIKLIDAKEQLSIQVHPNDIFAKKKYHSFGKTEMWYVIKSDENAFLYAGFKEEINEKQCMQSIENRTLVNYLHKYKVQSEDFLYIPAGCIHALGAGCFVVEIHQTSDITYRIYDYDRKDSNGHLRPLQVKLAQKVIDHQIRCCVKSNSNYTQHILPLLNSPYFSVNQIKAEKNERIIRKHKDRFVIYVCLNGQIDLIDKFNISENLQIGETLLIPATNSQNINLLFKKNSKLLEAYIEI